MPRLHTTAAILGLSALAGACSPPQKSDSQPSAAVSNRSSDVVAAAAPSTIPADPRTVTVNVQGVAPVGVTLRVKSIELGSDATTLDVSASYGGTVTNSLELAGSPTYLLADNGDRLMLKPPQDNQSLRITRGQTMEGKLVFLGAVAPGATTIKLVVNDNNDGDSIISPGLTMTIPLEPATK